MILSHEDLAQFSTENLEADVRRHEKMMPEISLQYTREWNQATIDALKAEIKRRKSGR